MDSIVTASAGVVKKALAATGVASCASRATIAAPAVILAGKAMSKVSKTLAASTVSVTDDADNPTSVATLERISCWTVAVKSDTSPAAITAVVMIVTVSGEVGGNGMHNGQPEQSQPTSYSK
jgi:hypothetical protein